MKSQQFEGVTIADPFLRGKLLSRDKLGNEIRLKRFFVLWGKLDGKPCRFKIVKTPIRYESFANYQKRMKK